MKEPAGEKERTERSDDSRSIAESLLLRVASGEDAAWQDLVQLYGPVVFDWCRRAGLQAEDAADVGQEVFRGVAMSIQRFRRDAPEHSFRGWLWAITQNKLRDFWRRQREIPKAVGGTSPQILMAQLAEEETTSVSSQDKRRTTGEFHRALEMIRADFEEKTWRAFWRVAVDKEDPAQVAEELAMSRGAVYIAKSRVLRRLRDEFEELIE